MTDNRKPDPGLAAVFSFIYSGLGQIYNGQILKGLSVISFTTFSLIIFICGSIIIGFWFLGKILSLKLLYSGIGLALLGLISICLLGMYSIFDAYSTASKK